MNIIKLSRDMSRLSSTFGSYSARSLCNQSILSFNRNHYKPKPSLTNVIPKRELSFAGAYTTVYQELFAPHYFHMEFLIGSFDVFHTLTAMPWWSTIICTTLLVRSLVAVPLYFYSIKNASKAAAIYPYIQHSQHVLMDAARKKGTELNWSDAKIRKTTARALEKVVRDVFKKNKCHPLKSSVFQLIQFPLWINMSFAIRNICGFLNLPGLENAPMYSDMLSGGSLWFVNLCAPDPYMIIPILFFSANVINGELGYLKSTNPNKLMKGLRYVWIGISCCMLPFAMYAPTAVTLYWTVSAFHQLGMSLFFMNPKVKKACDIIIQPNESVTPYRTIMENAKTRYFFLKPFFKSNP